MEKGKFKSFGELSAAVGNGTEEDFQKRQKEALQKKIIANKNEKWLKQNLGNQVKLIKNEDSDAVAQKILKLFEEQHSRKWILHLISNFLPMCKANQVALVRDDAKLVCPLSEYELTDLQKIKVGDRDKHIGYSGENSSVLLSGISIYELNLFAYSYTLDFDNDYANIINYHLDKMRQKFDLQIEQKKRAKKQAKKQANNPTFKKGKRD